LSGRESKRKIPENIAISTGSSGPGGAWGWGPRIKPDKPGRSAPWRSRRNRARGANPLHLLALVRGSTAARATRRPVSRLRGNQTSRRAMPPRRAKRGLAVGRQAPLGEAGSRAAGTGAAITLGCPAEAARRSRLMTPNTPRFSPEMKTRRGLAVSWPR
jgi:hypothetical protein